MVNQRLIYSIAIALNRLANYARNLINKIALSLLYFIVITPMAIILRVLQKDLLNLKINKQIKTYWIKNPLPKERINFEDQF